MLQVREQRCRTLWLYLDEVLCHFRPMCRTPKLESSHV
jgi:hypothetical protein